MRTTAGRIPLILDVDTGIDDSLALLYAAASAEADLVAVTCLSGNAGAADVERNTRAVLELAGRADVEVALGRTTPLLRALEITPETHGPHGIGYAVLPEPSNPRSARFAPQLDRRRGAAAPGRADARHPRAAHEPRDRGPARARPAAAAAPLGR